MTQTSTSLSELSSAAECGHTGVGQSCGQLIRHVGIDAAGSHQFVVVLPQTNTKYATLEVRVVESQTAILLTKQ